MVADEREQDRQTDEPDFEAHHKKLTADEATEAEEDDSR
jgi:hypothetical protein